jgi:hypothetical protein
VFLKTYKASGLLLSTCLCECEVASAKLRVYEREHEQSGERLQSQSSRPRRFPNSTSVHLARVCPVCSLVATSPSRSGPGTKQSLVDNTTTTLLEEGESAISVEQITTLLSQMLVLELLTRLSIYHQHCASSSKPRQL